MPSLPIISGGVSCGGAPGALAFTSKAPISGAPTHLGIDSLVPADRFYGRWPEVIYTSIGR